MLEGVLEVGSPQIGESPTKNRDKDIFIQGRQSTSKTVPRKNSEHRQTDRQTDENYTLVVHEPSPRASCFLKTTQWYDASSRWLKYS